MPDLLPQYDTASIRAARPPKNAVDPRRPYAFLVEPERTANGKVEPVATVFLTNRECPFTCLMCDLWRNTTDTRVPPGAIVEQLDYALARLPRTRHIKLYNSGNFFDPQAVPTGEWPGIIDRVRDFETVIVENHPRLCGPGCVEFAAGLTGKLEVALGLETIHPRVLPALNKQMTVDDFYRAVTFLVERDIRVRAFVLLKPPFLDELRGREWALRTLQYAFDVGVECCAVIPTRDGNGIMERLRGIDAFAPPRLASLEYVQDEAVAWERGRVFVDLWDAERLGGCPNCRPARIERLRQINDRQVGLPRIRCDCGERE